MAKATEWKAIAKGFSQTTKSLFPSCEFAALNHYTQPMSMWGIFTDLGDAIQAGEMWARATGNGYKTEQRDNKWFAISEI